MNTTSKLQADVAKIVQGTPFKNAHKREAIEQILYDTLELIQSYQLSQEAGLTSTSSKPRGRPNQVPYRTILTAAIIRAWRVGQDEKPIVNRRLGIPSPFVVFATSVYRLIYVFNVIDNIDHYRSLGNHLEKNGFVKPL